jgi:hypothetical protein
MVLSSNEKVGGNPIDYNITTAFRECLEQSNLEDLGYNGDLFTWHNRQQDNQYIQARLDRFCASNDWIYNFSHYQNSHLLRYGSDHCPILLEFSTLTPPNLNHNRPIGKRFEQIWTEDEEHTRIVREAWDNHNQELQNKLEDTLSSLHYWGKGKFDNIPKKIKAAQNDLQQLNSNNHSGELMESIKSKEQELDNLLHQEELWWSQRSRVLWLKHGDRNTSFFHSKASHRRKKNRIEAITDA